MTCIAPGVSLRLEGVDGEFDIICRSLGLSGPEDFSIPAAAWEAMKARSSSELNSGSSGIKGVSPSMLKPPPGVVVSAVDDMCSKWDILRDLAPEGERKEGEEEEEKEKIDEIEEKWEVGEVAKKRGETSSTCSSWDLLRNSISSSTCSTWDLLMDLSSEGEVGEVANQRGDTRSNSIFSNVRLKSLITPGSWQKGELLGRGSFGTVYEGISEDGFFFAVKQVSLLDHGSQGKRSVVQLEHEIALLSQFEHENIVRYIGTEMDESNLYIFIEFVTKGSLLSLYRRYKLRDSQVSAYTRQILHGLKYLHDRNVVHRDIKCANILVDANGSVKVADFGLAKAIKLNDVKSCQGTPFWMAPEVVRGKVKGYGLPADIWSLGCTVLEMLTGQVPYSPMERISAMFRIGKGELPPVPDTLSRDARDFILQCLKVNPDDRPTAAQLLDHKFVQRSFSQSSGSASPHIPRRS
ncbi:putative mitogen-activated protein kinase kinase kinase STE-STE11 family [Medicago truncatula]|uniref:mitogen-activated protein kinase kinase kinase n=1 Tax=Medicago truncatula TaxID=3880 RepID=G7K913_MEDTR|nr:mitogen-activated protein kinase kinase kinase 1 [Medicago truncatula]AES97782.1 MAP kinase kinase kinase-like protein [Medicago truncatula]RHN55992.1 putative mitogen-activated protein kinase kinase kinase STE-STE11 family [Medicago truncatula]